MELQPDPGSDGRQRGVRDLQERSRSDLDEERPTPARLGSGAGHRRNASMVVEIRVMEQAAIADRKAMNRLVKTLPAPQEPDRRAHVEAHVLNQEHPGYRYRSR